MILDRLRALRARLSDDDVPPEGYKAQPVRWILDVSEDGTRMSLAESGASKKEWVQMQTPYTGRTSATRALLLVDKPDYVLGLSETDDGAAKAAERHAVYLALLDRAARETGSQALATLHAALSDAEAVARVRADLGGRAWKPGDLVAPRVGDVYPHRDAAVRAFWQGDLSAGAAEKSGLTAECLLCGEARPIARTHPIELLVGPDRVGLVTGNADAFLSHGLKQSEVAPMCLPCARAYGEALRYLLQSPDHHLRVGNATWLFWTSRPVAGFAFGRLLSDPQPADVSRLLGAAQAGHLPDLAAADFYALVVSSNKSRLVVRSWLTVPLRDVTAHLAAYFEAQRVAGFGGESPPVKLFALAATTVLDATKTLPAQTTEALLAHALTGRRLPASLLYQALARARAEAHPVTRPRAALVRLVLASLHPEIMTDAALVPDHPEPAYHCGRLLAVLDQLQRKAISPNATLVDRFYGSASTTPAAVFGTLLRKAQPHVAKLRTGGRDPWLDRRIGEIAAHIPAFPTTLTPVEQGLFALGFYQEKYRPFENRAGAPDAETPDDPTDA